MTDACRLVTWFGTNARPLPWRVAPRDPYRTLVSELMAQQTQLDRVVPRFEAFVLRFPNLRALAAATEDEVLELWSGLGYYRRARLLHALAREVTAAAGELPATAAELEQLPGIGPYTAAAVASMVHGEAVPLLDGNIARVGARVLALAADPRKTTGRKAILGWVREMMNGAPPGQVNEALMELGASICTPTRPDCGSCPSKTVCRARRDGNPTAYPPPRTTRPTTDLRWLAMLVRIPRDAGCCARSPRDRSSGASGCRRLSRSMKRGRSRSRLWSCFHSSRARRWSSPSRSSTPSRTGESRSPRRELESTIRCPRPRTGCGSTRPTRTSRPRPFSRSW